MQFAILHGPVFSVLQLKLKAGETIRAEAGAVICRSPPLELKSKPSDKVLVGALGAAMGGEKLYSAEYTAQEDGSEIVLAPRGMETSFTCLYRGKRSVSRAYPTWRTTLF